MTTATTPAQRYASISGAATYAGLSQESIRRKIRAGELTVFRPFPGKLLVDLRELDRLVRNSAGKSSTRGQHLAESRRQATGDDAVGQEPTADEI